jgi:hypothetical protein
MSLELVAPLDGLRVSFNLVRGDTSTATYECAFLWTDKSADTTQAQAATAQATIQVSPPSVEFEQAQAVPEDALAFARGLLRTMARSIDEHTKWPRRITRWRDK